MSDEVLPSFEVGGGNLDAFLKAAEADATASLADEPGCLQFDITADRTSPPVRVIFTEVYTDRDAFDRHLETPHLAAFRDSQNLCTEGPVQFLDRVAS
ncbi:putative quinol monooxygenase [Paracoccus nototheniae]|uniref:Quinol monooxygenase n=1 Tax=Paracoccus nototheniae TaxID=2489002 RepID=A0ABW4E0Z3_9RHOB|nr:putative quinol monooxygenase [Paracoccus nototheniae]